MEMFSADLDLLYIYTHIHESLNFYIYRVLYKLCKFSFLYFWVCLIYSFKTVVAFSTSYFHFDICFVMLFFISKWSFHGVMQY